MKNILKISLSIVIAITLLIVPMTVMAQDEDNYVYGDKTLTSGTDSYTIDKTHPYTVFIHIPDAVGEFTITANGGVIGIVSYTDMWVQNTPSEDNVKDTTVSWKCTDVNQAVIIAAKSDSDTMSITVSRKDFDTSGEISWIVYENKHTPKEFALPDDVVFDDLEYIDFEDTTVDEAVLGDDGYYHLNDKNGPVLFANLNDSLMSLVDIVLHSKITAIYYDDNDAVVEKYDFTDAVLEYLGTDDLEEIGKIGKKEVMYPLTEDIITIFKRVGETNNWYGLSGYVGGEYDDAHLFACYYSENILTLGDLDYSDNSNNNSNNNNSNNNNDTNTNNGESGTNTTNNNSNTNTSANNNVNTGTSTDKSPSTGDSIIALAIAMLSATALVMCAKKVTQ